MGVSKIVINYKERVISVLNHDEILNNNAQHSIKSFSKWVKILFNNKLYLCSEF